MTRQSLAIVASVMTPYRALLHRRLASEIPELDLHTILTHGRPNQPWNEDYSDLKTCHFRVSDTTSASVLSRPWHAIRQAVAIRDYLVEHEISNVIINGYSDLCRMTLLRILPTIGINTYLRGDSNLTNDRSRPRHRRTLKRLALWLLTRNCAGILAMGQGGRAYYQWYGHPNTPIYDVPCDVDLSLFAPASLPRTLHVGRTRTVLFAGRLVASKQVDLLIEAFLQVAATRSEWQLVIAGEGPEESSLRSLVPEESKEKVDWLGFVPHAELPALMSRADVFVLPSRLENWSVALTEALASGVPVIATDVSGAAQDLLRSPHSGTIISPTMPALAAALEEAVDDRWLASSEGARSAAETWHQRSDPVLAIRRLLDTKMTPAS